jgi:hypothetical protein
MINVYINGEEEHEKHASVFRIFQY